MYELEKEVSWLENLNKYHDDNPALKEAYEQIQTIRTLIGYKKPKPTKKYEAWEQKYFDLVRESTFDDENPGIKEAWDRYYMLKNLVQDHSKPKDTNV